MSWIFAIKGTRTLGFLKYVEISAGFHEEVSHLEASCPAPDDTVLHLFILRERDFWVFQHVISITASFSMEAPEILTSVVLVSVYNEAFLCRDSHVVAVLVSLSVCVSSNCDEQHQHGVHRETCRLH